MHTIDPECLPETAGTLERFLINHHGELDGMLLRGGVEVHFPPHMGAAVEALTKPGETVSVRGVHPRGAAVVAAVRVENARGDGVTDEGPPKEKEKHDREKARQAILQKRKTCQVEGAIACLLHGPKGETRGALLDDGTILRWPPHEGGRAAKSLHTGASVAARGDGIDTKFGTVVEVRRALGPSGGQLTDLHPKSKDGKHGPDKHDKRPSKPA